MTLKEEQIRPRKLFDEYLALAEQDAAQMVASAIFEEGLCFACGGIGKEKFAKLGFHYAECPECLTIFSNPRPSAVDLMTFYRDGKSTKFWASDFYLKTAEARREKLWKPKAQRVAKIINEQPLAPQWLCDIGGGFGLFVEEVSALMRRDFPVLVLEPSSSLASACRRRGLSVVEKFLEETTATDLPTGPGVFTSFELFEHLHNPRYFLQKVYELMPKNSLFIMTTLSGIGLDIRLLGSLSKSVFPPHHLNFSNPKALTALFTDIGFKGVEASTPGELDVDILQNSKDSVTCDFWKSFLASADKIGKEIMQKAISESGFSSHMWVTGLKR